MPCGERATFLEYLRTRHEEVPRGVGVLQDGRALEIVRGASGSFSILMTMPDGKTCLILSGEGWQEISQIAGRDS